MPLVGSFQETNPALNQYLNNRAKDRENAQPSKQRTVPQRTPTGSERQLVENVSNNADKLKPHGTLERSGFPRSNQEARRLHAERFKIPILDGVSLTNTNREIEQNTEFEKRPNVDSKLLHELDSKPKPIPISAFDNTLSFDLEDDFFSSDENPTTVLRGPDQHTTLKSNNDTEGQNKAVAQTDPENWFHSEALKWEIQEAREALKVSSHQRRLDAFPLHDAPREMSLLGDPTIGQESYNVSRKAALTSNIRLQADEKLSEEVFTQKSVAFDTASPVPPTTDGSGSSSPIMLPPKHSPNLPLSSRTKNPKRTDGESVFGDPPEQSFHGQAKKVVPNSSLFSSKVDHKWQNMDDQTGTLTHSTIIQSHRDSDYPTSSDDELPDPKFRQNPQTVVLQDGHLATGRKRTRVSGLDYDEAELKNMNFEDLHRESFNVDPRLLPPDSAPTLRSSSKSLSEKLTDLGRLDEQGQQMLFQSQSDEEWQQTGSWFVRAFHEDLKRLMVARLERRKASMRFEDQIRRRQRQVERCIQGVDDELRMLKKGGGELVKGRESTTPKK